ncbi:uncharacterized protein DNG_04290 [Cephalotrichum gorgonifer]|uniref:Glycosyl hydrolase family 95 N-terminal domain-containing protein n=1 Tax=Cephalotrichum gorgonifer TaxID=2041049 RepID=A0AAE8MYL2_9PEZI|nr:uncharacterized protein DNG_04290 [Cephalotrichum gorgonifer]
MMIPPRLCLGLFLVWSSSVLAQWDASRFAWYTTDAGGDFSSALPIGNGRLGAAIFGSAVEHIVLNEDSVWSGPWQDRVNPSSKTALPKILEFLRAGDITAAGDVAMGDVAANPTSPRAYNPLVSMDIDFGHDSGLSSYTRSLDTAEGTATVTYTNNNVNYTREYVTSYPHGVFSVRLSASQPGKLDVKVTLSRDRWVLSQTAGVNTDYVTGGNYIALKASSGQESDAITFWSEARFVNSGGSISSDGKSVSVTGADSCDIFFDAETSYRYPDETSALAELNKKLDTAVNAGFSAVRSAAISDFTGLTGRVSLDLGSSGDAGNQETPTRLANYRRDPDADPQLVTLMFNFGRHLLAAASRDTGPLSLPTNLQGIWNQDYDPPWQSKFTININTEMNYWPALVTNLAETHSPLFNLLRVAIPRGREVAKNMYGCKEGFVLHHNTDLWGDAAPVDQDVQYLSLT